MPVRNGGGAVLGLLGLILAELPLKSNRTIEDVRPGVVLTIDPALPRAVSNYLRASQTLMFRSARQTKTMKVHAESWLRKNPVGPDQMSKQDERKEVLNTEKRTKYKKTEHRRMPCERMD